MFKRPKISDLSIQSQLFLAMMVAMLIFLIGIGGYTYLNVKERIKDNTSQYIRATLDQALARLDTALTDMDKATKLVDSNSNLQAILLKKNLSQYINNNDLTSIHELINTLSIQNEFIDSIEIYGNKGILYPPAGPVIQEVISISQLNEIIKSNGTLVWLGYRNAFALFDKPTIIGIRRVQFNYDSEKAGYLVVYVKPSFLQIILKKFPLANGDSISLIDRGGRILSSSNEKEIGQLIDNGLWEKAKGLASGSFSMNVNGKKMFINLQTLERTGWAMVYQLPENRFSQSFLPIRKIFLLASAIGIIFSFVLSILLASGVTKPVRKLVREMRKVQLDNITINPILTSNKEMKELSLNYQKMMLELKRLIQQVYLKEILQNQAEMKALQSQINPHFLYNTLDTIHWMLVINGQDETSKLVSDLAKLMRYTINNESDIATLEMEIDHLKRYLTIQKARFYDKLQYEFLIDSSLLHIEIPRLILQPLVENAIVHGLEKVEANGLVIIRVYAEEGDLHFEVIDNGIGIPPEKLKRILLETLKSREYPASGIGLYNVHKRIQLLYGVEYGLKISSKVHHGTIVSIRLPVVSVSTIINNNKSQIDRGNPDDRAK